MILCIYYKQNVRKPLDFKINMITKSIETKMPTEYLWYKTSKLLLFFILMSLPFSLQNKSFEMFWRLVLIFGIPIILYIYLSFKNFSYKIEDGQITIREGIILKGSKTIFFNNIQNIETYRGIMSRFFGLTKISFWTSSPSQIEIVRGNSNNNPDICFYLKKEDTKNILEIINKK